MPDVTRRGQVRGPMTMTLKQLEAFVWIVDLGSFRAAAERLHTTQPNISVRLSTLETALGVTLMERDAGSVRLTPRGRDLLDHARRVLREADALIEASGETQLFDGSLRLGVTEIITQTWLRAFLRAFRARYPNISVELTAAMSASLEQELFARALDLALQNGPFTRTATGVVPLGRYPLIWVASPALNLHGRRLSAAELAAQPVLTHARGSLSHAEVAEHFRDRRALAVRLVPSSNLAAGMDMARDGMGVAAMPEVMAAPALAQGELVRLDYPWVPKALEFVARYDAATSPGFVAAAAEIARQVAADYAPRPEAPEDKISSSKEQNQII